MVIRRKKKLSRMGKKMDYGRGGMRMDRRRQKGLTRMENKLVNGLGTTKMVQ